ncbi:hypothetical protein PCORN_08772 [Listeria cornellensis FSL F6-0969]|uniref:Uncharacterized protein n=1 Tax=Listeria cornellensis FSL F6-0969 TaxID=1265820 RepID=W7BZA5_9LIST|nr:hypothetical protein PCORN_08772 [Listeria cornellensis FSL F6-0969]
MRKFYLYFILVMGLVMIGLGLWFVFNPSTSLAAFTFVIGIVLLLNGLNEIISYFKGRKVLKNLELDPFGWGVIVLSRFNYSD